MRYAGAGTDRTYAYLLVDHLRWLESEGVSFESVGFQDLQRYMGAVGAEVPIPFGSPWRVGKKPYGDSALAGAASCMKGFYLHQAGLGFDRELAKELNLRRLPTKADRSRSLLGHAARSMASNPLARRRCRRHPKMLPDGARGELQSVVSSLRDGMAVDWLSDGGFRAGELCGLHLSDLHLRENAECGQCRGPHAMSVTGSDCPTGRGRRPNGRGGSRAGLCAAG